MSSNIEIQKYCEYCGNEFTAKTTVTRYCSDVCSKRAYKARKRAEKINSAIVEVKKVEQKPIEVITNKDYLNINEVCQLLGISRRTVYRLIENGDIEKIKIRSRTIFKRSTLNKFIDTSQVYVAEISELSIPKSKDIDFNISECYTVAEVQEKFNVSQTALQNIIRRESIPKKQKGKFVYVPKELIDNIFK